MMCVLNAEQRHVRRSVLVQRESWRMLHDLRQSFGTVEMEASIDAFTIEV